MPSRNTPISSAWKLLTWRTDDDNWDNDFATAISPGVFHLPHVKGQDNFGGLFSADRLKAFASSLGPQREEMEGLEDVTGGELETITDLHKWSEADPQEQTIRPPPPRKTSKSGPSKSSQQGHRRQKSSRAGVSVSAPSSQPKSPLKAAFGAKFELPPRRDQLYREQSMEDYSDLVDGDDSVFNQRLNLVGKVRSSVSVCPLCVFLDTLALFLCLPPFFWFFFFFLFFTFLSSFFSLHLSYPFTTFIIDFRTTCIITFLVSFLIDFLTAFVITFLAIVMTVCIITSTIL
jgi:hypothetical protein